MQFAHSEIRWVLQRWNDASLNETVETGILHWRYNGAKSSDSIPESPTLSLTSRLEISERARDVVKLNRVLRCLLEITPRIKVCGPVEYYSTTVTNNDLAETEGSSPHSVSNLKPFALSSREPRFFHAWKPASHRMQTQRNASLD